MTALLVVELAAGHGQGLRLAAETVTYAELFNFPNCKDDEFCGGQIPVSVRHSNWQPFQADWIDCVSRRPTTMPDPYGVVVAVAVPLTQHAKEFDNADE